MHGGGVYKDSRFYADISCGSSNAKHKCSLSYINVHNVNIFSRNEPSPKGKRVKLTSPRTIFPFISIELISNILLHDFLSQVYVYDFPQNEQSPKVERVEFTPPKTIYHIRSSEFISDNFTSRLLVTSVCL